ncbi:beta-propeller fold lactonase family protein [Streptomyces vinaceus]|uniref:beta-propeller fold lactonase family protein n=1 Tax=Streptomyces vinaceus TaxID=1960 RepID=UPI0036B245E4
MLLVAMVVPTAVATPAAAQPPSNPNEYLYTANSLPNPDPNETQNSVAVSNLNYGDVVGIADLGTSTSPSDVAVNQNGTRAYSANTGTDNVSVIDATTDLVIATVAVGDAPQNLAITPDGLHVYVVNQNSNNISVIDTVSNTVSATIENVGVAPFGVAITRTPSNQSLAYVSLEGSGDVLVINADASPPSVIATIPDVMQSPQNVAASSDGFEVYAVGLNSAGVGRVSAINTSSNAVTHIDLPGATPFDVAANPVGGDLYVSDTQNDQVLVIDPAGLVLQSTVPLDENDHPFGVTYSNDGNFVYVANFGDLDAGVKGSIDTIGAYLDSPEVTDTDDSRFINGPVGLAAGPIPGASSPTKLTVTVDREGKGPRSAANSEDATLRAKLTSNGQPLRDKVIHFTSGSSTTPLCTGLTDRGGTATCTLGSSKSRHDCHTATFKGIGSYQPATAFLCRGGDGHGKPHPKGDSGHGRVHQPTQATAVPAV